MRKYANSVTVELLLNFNEHICPMNYILVKYIKDIYKKWENKEKMKDTHTLIFFSSGTHKRIYKNRCTFSP